jgi:hypothetical protein
MRTVDIKLYPLVSPTKLCRVQIKEAAPKQMLASASPLPAAATDVEASEAVDKTQMEIQQLLQLNQKVEEQLKEAAAKQLKSMHVSTDPPPPPTSARRSNFLRSTLRFEIDVVNRISTSLVSGVIPLGALTDRIHTGQRTAALFQKARANSESVKEKPCTLPSLSSLVIPRKSQREAACERTALSLSARGPRDRMPQERDRMPRRLEPIWFEEENTSLASAHREELAVCCRTAPRWIVGRALSREKARRHQM